MDLRERPSRDFVRHPWETARSSFFARLVERRPDGSAPRILDVGSGDTWFAAELAARLPGARIRCWDRSYTPELIASLAAAAPEGVELSAARPAGSFDWLILLDVLEHVEDDRGFLRELVGANLAPGGRLLVSVPAWPSLFGRRDLGMGHLRRYSRRACHGLLAGAGLRIRESGGLFHSLLPLRLASVWGDRMRRRSGPRDALTLEWRHGPASARWVHRWLLLDAGLGRVASRLRLDCPGLSCWALCERSR